MPVQNRKYFISRHNKDTEAQNNIIEGHSKSEIYTGEATNTFSKISMLDYNRIR
jgi:hypothetical protein